jgi:methyltransferase (TIGR00027 family)
VLTEAIGAGVRQVVNLGAGSDSRPYRLGMPADTTVFEVDMPGLLPAKHRVLQASGASPTCQLVMVDVDLREDWPTALTNAGYVSAEPTVWIVEGLFYYLQSDTADMLLERISSLSAPGSWLELDIPHRRYREEPANSAFLTAMAKRGVPFVGASDQPGDWLRRHGWTAEVFSATDLVAGHGPVAEPAPPRLYVPARPVWLALGRR